MTEKKKTAYVTRIETNVKSRRGVAYDLTPCTIITGPNGSGKSALVDAISLSLTGTSRSEGLKKATSLLLRLAPPGPAGTAARELYARAKLSDGVEANFSLVGGQVEWSAGVALGVVITDVARALLYGDAKALVQSIAQSTRAVIFRDALESEVTRGVLPLFNEIWRDDCGLDSALERSLQDVQKCLDAVKVRLTAAHAAKRAVKGGTALAVPLAEDEEAELLRAEAVLGALEQGQTLEALRDSLSDLLPFNPEEHDRLVDRMTMYTSIAEALSLMDKHVAKGKALACPVCKRSGLQQASLRQRAEQLLQRAQETNAVLSRGASVLKQHALFADVCSFTARSMTAVEVQARRTELLSRREAAAVAPARAAIKAVTEDEINQLETIRAVCEEAIKNATDQQLGTVERRINRALPTNYRAKVISAGGYRIELVKDKDDLQRDFRALSGAEKTLLLSAFASATIPEDAPPVRLLVVDETWLDPRHMKALMKALTKVVGTESGPSQAILCAVKFSGKAVDGWSEVKLDAAAGDEEVD